MKIYVGLDLGVNKTALCCIDENGESLLRAVVPSEPGRIIAKLRTLPNPVTMIGLEACPLSEWIYGALVDEEYETYCLETRHTQRFLSSRPNKTDRTDARGIAEMMRIGHFKSVHVKSEESQILRAILMGRRQFMASMLQIENTMRGLLRIRGLKLGKVHRLKFSEKVMEMCEDAPELLPAIEPLLVARNSMRDELRKLNNLLGRKSRNDEVCKRFLQIPGVGPLTSLAFKATIDDPARFSSSKIVPAHLGLTPRIYQSGETDRSGRISKSGDKLLRYLLVEAATSMLLISKKWCALKLWGIQLAKRVGKPKAIVAVARKLAMVMHRMWVTGDDFKLGDVPVGLRTA